MRRILLMTAVPLALYGGTASADSQSVLERVMDSVGTTHMSTLNGVFANVAESIGVVSPSTVYLQGSTPVTTEQIQTAFDTAKSTAITTAVASVALVDTNGSEPGGDKWQYNSVNYDTQAAAQAAASAAAAAPFNATNAVTWALSNGYTSQNNGPSVLLNAIDGSISNVLSGAADPTAAVGSTVTAVEQVTVDLGNMSTTVLGAVNTGEITLGVNQNVTEAIAGSSSAVSNAITQLGGAANTSAVVLNVAANTTDILGSVKNTFDGLNGSVGNVATTVLGAVNTGTITSGINAAVTGVQSGITGTGH